MGDRLIKKGLAIGIIVLFITTIFTPNIIAVDLSKHNTIEHNNTISSASEISKNWVCIRIVDLIPYEYYGSPDVYDLCVTCEIKNVGDEPYSGDVGYRTVSINMFTHKVEDTMRCTKSGGLVPGESWCPYNGYGARFGKHFFPTFFRVLFYSIPEMTAAQAIYLVWGCLFGQYCKKLLVFYYY